MEPTPDETQTGDSNKTASMSENRPALAQQGTRFRHKWYARVFLVLTASGLCLGVAEIGSRVFWRHYYDTPLRDASRILYAYYPELREVDEERPSRTDDLYDILFLGGSTLDRDWGVVDQALVQQLASKGYRNVRIFNLARPAQTSRDSLLKYAALGEARFDLVIVYDGFNEARANNIPPELFREDYGHYSWYEMVNTLAPYHGRALFALSYTLPYLAVRMRQSLANENYVPTDEPRKDWVEYGRVPRSVDSLKHNLATLLDLASQRGDPVMAMTFAVHVPTDYSYEGFKEMRLDYQYQKRSFPLEFWGRPDDVVAAVAAHNEVVRSLAADHAGVLFVDQARLMEGSSRFFIDPCHLTIEGSTKFAANIVGVLVPHLEARGVPVSPKGQ